MVAARGAEPVCARFVRGGPSGLIQCPYAAADAGKSRVRSHKAKTAWTTKIGRAAAVYYAVGTPENCVFPVPGCTGREASAFEAQDWYATPPDIGEVNAKPRLVERIND